jgi:lantibiotic modifying enzyme
MKRAAEEVGPRHELDLVSGSAGGVAGAVLLAEVLGDRRLLEVAELHAERVLEHARSEERGWSWPSPAWPSKRNLTGFSHGAAGIGFALLELHRVTGEGAYRQAAQQAFEYERAWFDPARGNWPDFREDPANRKLTGRRRVPPAFQVAWCHGAPGIALSRIAAARILDDPMLEVEARKGLDVSEATTKGWLGGQEADFCLCHGLAGNAEVLALGGRAAVAEEIARVGMERHSGGAGRWPFAMGAHESPGLMTGLAGVGYFYLRMGAPSVPSVLFPVVGERALGRGAATHA